MSKRTYTLQKLDTENQADPWVNYKHIGTGDSLDDDKAAMEYVKLSFYDNSFFKNRKLRLIVSEVLSYNDKVNEQEKQSDENLQ